MRIGLRRSTTTTPATSTTSTSTTAPLTAESRSGLDAVDARSELDAVDASEVAATAPPEAESQPAVIARETEESLTSALQDSDTAAEVLHDSAEDSTRPGTRRLVLGTIGLALTASSVLAARRISRSRKQPRRWRLFRRGD